jgi:ABC-type sugar transport system permease subunit
MTAWQQQRSRSAIWFLLPAMVLLGLFVLWPLLRTAYWSFTNADLLATDAAAMIGPGNYSDLLVDPRFRRAFFNTAWFAIMVVPLQTLAGFLLALWVNRPERAWRWLRVVFFAPVIISMPVLAVLWTMLYPRRGNRWGWSTPGSTRSVCLPRPGCANRRSPSRPSRPCRSGRAWACR